MVLIPKVLRTCSLILCLLVNVHAMLNASTKPWIVSFKVVEKSCVENNCKYLLNVRGGEFLGHYSWRLTPKEASRGGACDVISSNYELRKVNTESWKTEIEVIVPHLNGKIYFCLHNSDRKFRPFGGEWVHQGTELFLDPSSDEAPRTVGINQDLNDDQAQQWDLSHDTDINYLPHTPAPHKEKYIELFNKSKGFETNLIRKKRNVSKSDVESFTSKRNVNVSDTTKVSDAAKLSDDMDFYDVKAVVVIKIDGLRVEEGDKDPKIENGIPSVLADSKFKLRLFGQGFTTRTVIAFTEEPLEYGQPCKFLVKNGEYMVIPESIEKGHASALFEVRAPAQITDGHLYICAKNLRPGITNPSKDEENHLHQGTETWKRLAIHQKLLPLWVTLTLILICLTFSALFSGLNLGLMSLDRTELKIISNTGTEQERKYARAIMPVRDHGNYLLCSILLGNVAVNSTFTILLDELTSGLFAVIFSTLAIVLLGEITPQAICSRHGLMVGARSIVITKGVMALTAPLAFPVSKILDYLLGEEIGNVYNRERLKELVKVTTDVNDLDKDEVNIISGALELRKKSVSDVMTKLEDVFMLPITSVLDFETMSEIVKSGYSRIPVYEGHRGNIVTVLFIKDLAFVDPDDNTPLRTLAQYYQNPCNFVFEDVTLDVMFKQFKDGHKGHMAFVHRINNEGEGDPFYETIGLVTLEDVIEEMIQSEIVDETDVFMDNRTKRRRNKPTNKLQDFGAFAERHENQRTHISPQLTLATFQFLSSSVEAFRPDTVSETVLRRLLKQDVIHHIKLKGKSKKDSSTYVYQQGKPVDYFVLILEGRVEVTVGRENLVFEAGPFTYFGVQALTQNIGVAESPTPSAMGSLQNINMDSMLRHTFVPDYSVRATAELFYLTVKRALYLAAKRATLMEKGALSKGATNDQLDNELDKQMTNSASVVPKQLVKCTSTASKESTTSSNKSQTIIQLKQVTQSSSAKLPYGYHYRQPSCSKYWPNKSFTKCNQAKSLPNTTKPEESDVTCSSGSKYWHKLIKYDQVNSFPPTRLAKAKLENLDLNDKYIFRKEIGSEHLPNTSNKCVQAISLPNNLGDSSILGEMRMSFEKLDHCDKYIYRQTSGSKCWPNNQAKSLSNTAKYSNEELVKSVAYLCLDSSNVQSELDSSSYTEMAKLSVDDANSCVECVRNNFWINKSVDNLNYDQNKKKKTTFHTDSSLLTFHNLSPSEDSNLGPPKPVHQRLETENKRKDLLQSVDEDISISGEHKTPSRQVSPNPLPVSASPHTRASFTPRPVSSPERNGDYIGVRDEEEKLLK